MKGIALIRAIGSWQVTAAICIAHAGLYVIAGINEDAPYQRFLQLLWHTPLGVGLYAALVCSLCAASVMVILKRLWPQSISPDNVRGMDSYIELGPEAAIDPELWIRQRGFSPRIVQGGMIARKGVLAIIPGTVARVGILLMLLALPASERMREAEEAVLTQGRSAVLLGQEVRLKNLSHGIPGEFFQIGDSATFEIDSASARLSAGGREFEIKGSGPVRAAGVHYRITHMGYWMSVKKGSIEQDIALDVLPPGRVHRIKPDGISVRLEPEELVKKGLLTGKRYRLEHPLLAIAIDAQDENIMLRPGERDAKSGLGLGPLGYYAKVTAVRDPALAWVSAGLMIALAGGLMMLGRFFWYERRFACASDGDRIVIGYSEEFLKKWGIYKFRGWTEGLSGD